MRTACLILLCALLQACSHAVREDEHATPLDAASNRYILVTLRNAGAAPVARAGSSPRDYGSPLFYGLSSATRATAARIASDYHLQPANEWPIAQLGVHCVVYRLDAGQTQSELLQRLRADPRIESAQPLNAFRTYVTQYNDPYAGLQRSLASLGVPAAHTQSRGRGVTVAIIDTAADVRHVDLARRDVVARDYTGTHGAPAAHGTAVAGIIAARTNNLMGIVGIAPEAKVVSLAACWPTERDAVLATCNSFTLAKALAAAIDLRADVVNLSLGGPSDPLLKRLVEVGLKRGMTFVGAVPERAPVGFPCDIAGVIAVDSLGHAGVARDALLAPGTDVLTLLPHDRYDFLSGSSLAAANVTGSVALLLSEHRDWDAARLRNALAASSAGGGGINVCAALLGMDAPRCHVAANATPIASPADLSSAN